MIRTILADDHNLVRQGIRLILENADDIEILGEAETGEEAVNLTRELQPDVLIMDINMPRLNGIQATEQIKRDNPATQIVILSMHSDETLIRQALSTGVKGYILKRSATEELLLAIRAAYRGETFLCSSISNFLVNGFLAGQPKPEATDGFDQLTTREREVFKLIVESHSNKTIAETMNISVKTVEKHRANLMNKLNVQDLIGLIRIAVKHGLIFLDE